MKKVFVLSAIAISLSIGISACGGGSNNSTDTNASGSTSATAGNPDADSVPSDVSANPDYQKGLGLISKSDCLTCHQISSASTGPAYQDVANKYDNSDATVTSLAQKVIKGGSGVWGTVPMTPHADLSVDDAKAMVKYILLLKTKK